MLTLNQVGIIKQTVDERISAATRALVALHGMRNADLADVLGIGQNSVFMKLRGDSPWKASEVAIMAEYFGVPIASFYDDLASLYSSEAPAQGARASVVRHQGLEPRTH
ncbi:hypothetical protein COP05_03960 [Dermabacter jinjuensis]|uniref:Transcription regulator BetR N-terminal domain-containing protein n=2 Tax=Dermabacter jinjuensis TaxID=1667168 RepID=A0ABM6PLP9_9MICO|nr:hypothetical protein COP05_03960 [Dermabacter jinjuensis]